MKPKYIRVLSDLHLEQYFGQKVRFLCDTFVPADAYDSESILILAGDISSKPVQLYEFLDECLLRFQKVIFISGNHEYYGHAMDKWESDFREWSKDKLNLLAGTDEMQCIELEGVRIIFGTLWAYGGDSLAERASVGRYLRDFYVIRKSGQERWTVPHMAEMFKKQKKQLEEFIAQPFDGKTVVVTHHMPSLRLCHPRFGAEANGGFASNCDLMLATDKIDLWIHGHTHDTGDHMMWNTRVVCNPSGYFMEQNSPFTRYHPKFIDLQAIAIPKEPYGGPWEKLNGDDVA